MLTLHNATEPLVARKLFKGRSKLAHILPVRPVCCCRWCGRWLLGWAEVLDDLRGELTSVQ